MTEAIDAGALAVIIPTRDRWAILRRTLDALRNQTVTGFETVVVVDGDEHAPSEIEGVRLLRKEHGGPGVARNFGVEHTDTPLLMFLGDDMVPEPRLIERHLAAHATHPDTADAVIGHVTWHPEIHRDRLLRWLDWSGTQFDFVNIVGNDAGWGRFYSCNVSLKRELFTAAGAFDPAFTYYYEDLDLAWRLRERGLRLHYERDARTQHLHPYSWGRLEGRFRGIAEGERMMAEKHDWFEPFFAGRIDEAMKVHRRSRVWPLIVDAVPRRLPRARAAAERRADTWYYQQLAPAFRSVWDGHVPAR